ncbi:MAG TPA: hypothetical protein VKR53_06305 [Puia sp.]|nr:hypothetical protein [Puia sp.]
MEKTNYDFLADDLKYLGFGESLMSLLEEKIKENANSFELYFSSKIDNNPIDAILYFSRPSLDGFYFFSDYVLTLGNKLHHFKIFKGKGVTLKEGYNLLCGRAVFKQLIGKNGQKYDAWIQLDLSKKEGENFKINTYHESYGYDLSAALDHFPIETPSANWDRPMLIKSLQRGNLQSAFLRGNGGMKKILIEANPAAKTITIREGDLTPAPDSGVAAPADISQGGGDDIENGLKKTTGRARKSKDI